MIFPEFPLVLQTSYAELVEQLQLSKLSAWPPGSTFRKRTLSGQDYWYVQEPTRGGVRPGECYVGKSSPQLDATIEQAREQKSAVDSRRLIVRSLLAAQMPQPERLSGDILAHLSQHGLFRLRAVLVGTQAYQLYPALLGVKLPSIAIQTGDLDIAQDFGVSVALNDQIGLDFLDALKQVDQTFRPATNIFEKDVTSSYITRSQFRVDVLTTNRGAEQRSLPHLPSLRSEATPLRFLDFLLRETVPAAVLHKSGILVNAPSPQRFAIHQLIVAAERGNSNPKSSKDLIQAETLILALAQRRRTEELIEACREALEYNSSWRQLLQVSLKMLSPKAAEILQQADI